MEKTKKVFRSRISVLLLALILAPLAIVVIPAITHRAYEGLYITGGAYLFIAFLLTGMRYEISGNKLYQKIWFIPNGGRKIDDIIVVERTYNPISSHAGSLKRLEIRFRTGILFWLVSPVREKEFIEALKAINPYIRVNVPEKKGKWHIWDWDI